ncbi:MAG: response regulator [Nitrospirae bacterium CG01_land_8_20_14_3_00_44_22]|nr:MAG: response regulator [Nitrospirae bacterium CG01_land_8_20_14_3_00_44_22]PIW90684.1 MAG: response regulator [Nitrospirae bacterium CG_4_8_14_3_um_filter_44_28]
MQLKVVLFGVKTDNKKILVADDDVLLRKLLNDLLTFYGYDVACVSNGKEALARIETDSYDVLITDYMMPEMNGIELIKKARYIKKSLAIIGMSASEEEKGFLAAGANLFIAKPFSPYALKNIIEEICLT